MQNRMKTHQLTEEQTLQLLERTETGALATVDVEGRPYAVPVHFVWLDGKIYVHGLPVGEKVSNLKANPAVCLTAWDMQGYLMDPEGKPCDTNTKYQSAVIKGTARMVEDTSEKLAALHAVVAKYTPGLADKELPPAMVNGTGVIEITVDEMTGKYYEQ
ncbi:MAG: pyridoxamine 5'-phosphate oxidase family protein [Solobacterium sp.]|nr:pyridoxamine 5'-phosphate oxidase family protein [Solobacterium sp.]MBQ1355196.1 pyridoxamine 5'-phosphate oxidase family protein [Solobacterium sp.]